MGAKCARGVYTPDIHLAPTHTSHGAPLDAAEEPREEAPQPPIDHSSRRLRGWGTAVLFKPKVAAATLDGGCETRGGDGWGQWEARRAMVRRGRRQWRGVAAGGRWALGVGWRPVGGGAVPGATLPPGTRAAKRPRAFTRTIPGALGAYLLLTSGSLRSHPEPKTCRRRRSWPSWPELRSSPCDGTAAEPWCSPR